MTRPTNCGRWVGSVPAVTGTGACTASEPARTIPTASAVLYQTVPTVMPANAEPLLLAAEVNAYSTSDRPCGPELSMPARSPGSAIATPVPTSTQVGVAR